MSRRALCLSAVVAALVAPLAAGAAEKPSFDCATARTARETMVCRTPRLAAADRAMAAAYTEARKRLSKATAEVLKQDQKRFLEQLDNGFDAEIWFKGSVPDDAKKVAADLAALPKKSPETLDGLRDEIERRTEALRTMREDRVGFVGRWVSADTILTIGPAVDGHHPVAYDDPSYGWPKYQCHFTAKATPNGDRLVATFDPTEGDEDLARGRLGVTRTGPFLDILETLDESKSGDDREYWICNHSPEVKGRFLAVGGR